MTGQDEPAGGAGADGTPTFAHKLDLLFRAHGDPSLREVTEAIRRRTREGGATISATYLWLLRTGRRRNPTLDHLALLADHFAVSPAYFFDDALVDRTASWAEADLELLGALRDPAVRALALQAKGLSVLGRQALGGLAVQLERIEAQAGVRRTAGAPRRRRGAT